MSFSSVEEAGVEGLFEDKESSIPKTVNTLNSLSKLALDGLDSKRA
ncbi:hypothetical protein ECOLI_p10007 [Escherichia coli]|uniref:Uncharacterized protein n=1 Tax=Klebsiella pneumoniae TaxID=573 RepID=A0A2R4NET6_KLEPN|nr:hypothetical protein [Klebsiella pneumoniae]CTQ85714.1 hypothetical protein ECOLI_p10007 [Escherichia coli]SPN80247.1 hypothetical protein PCNR481_0086 [Klebsiella pneumoniae]